MGQAPLNASGGSAAVVRTRMADADVARLLGLAALKGVKPGTLARQALVRGLDQLEQQNTGHPDARSCSTRRSARATCGHTSRAKTIAAGRR